MIENRMKREDRFELKGFPLASAEAITDEGNALK